MKNSLKLPIFFAALLFLFSCEKEDLMENDENFQAEAASASSNQLFEQAFAKDSEGVAGAVFTMSNSTEGNAIIAFTRSATGDLQLLDEYPTNGYGTGAGLGSQGALVLFKNKILLAVNAGSNDMSALRITPTGLKLIAKVKTQGVKPISLTAHKNMVYVLNAGDDSTPPNITGFQFDNEDSMYPIKSYTKPLSGDMVGPAQVQFSPNGYQLIVTEKGTNQIISYNISMDGEPSDPIVNPSVGMTPFGFTFDKKGRLLVSEAFGGTASAVSSYYLGNDGQLEVISPSVDAPGEQAACWIVLSKNDQYAYTTNTATNSVSAFMVEDTGMLSLLGDPKAGMTGAGPIDMALSQNSRFLYTLNSGDNSISAFMLEIDGSLTPMAGIESGLPAGAVGLAAR